MGTKTKKVCLRVAMIGILLITLGLVVRAIFNYTTGKKLARTIANMEANGKRLTIREFEPECEDQDNAALIWKGVEAMFLVEADERKMLSVAMEDVFYGRPLSEDIRGRINEILARNKKILPFIQEAAEKPCFKYNSEWDRPPDEMEMPNAVKLISLLRLYDLDSVLKADDGYLEDAIEQSLHGIRLSRKFLNGPFLINHLISIALMKQQLVCLNKIVAGQNVDTELLEIIFDELGTIPWTEGYIKSIETERAYSLNLGMRMIGGDPMSPDLKDRNWVDRVDCWLFRPVYKSVLIDNLRFWEDIDKAAPLPYYKTKDTRDWISKKMNDLPWYSRMAEVLLPNLTTVMFKQALTEARLLTARIGIACKIFHNKKGRYPQEISDLVPEFLAKEPLDPFTGMPFLYRRGDSGFIVYSIGSNEKDDDGRGTWNITALVMEKDDDHAWQESFN